MATTFITRSLLRSGVGVLILGSAIVATSADAATQRTTYRTAVSSCAAPLPNFDVDLWKSIIGIKNQGTHNIVVTCSMPADYVGDMTTGVVEIHFHNFGGSSATVNCTMYAGNRFAGFGAVAASTSVGANGDGYLSWLSIDKHDSWGSYNFNCVLPPNVELNTIINQNNDTGDGL